MLILPACASRHKPVLAEAYQLCLAISRFAKASGYALVEEYSDLGVSGTKELGDRHGLAALLDHLESNGVRVVIVECADRLARALMVQEVILGLTSSRRSALAS